MGSFNIWLRARKFFREVSTAKLIYTGGRNSPERRVLLQCIFGYIIMSRVLFSKDFAIQREKLSVIYIICNGPCIDDQEIVYLVKCAMNRLWDF